MLALRRFFEGLSATLRWRFDVPGRLVFETLINISTHIYAYSRQTRLQDRLVCFESCYSEPVDRVFGKKSRRVREGRLFAQAFPRVVVDVGADTCHVKGREGSKLDPLAGSF